jgi:NAD(P)-dependent dehydrogenase (short-subunit alcohol dehydrogenase family)
MGLIDLAGRTALVTGAAKRVGRSIACALADQGANILVHYNTSKDEAEALVADLEERGVEAWAVQASLDDPLQIEDMWERALGCAHRGGISLLVNNASIFPADTLGTLTDETLRQNLSINALAPLRLIRLFAGGMGQAGNRHGGKRIDGEAQACVVNVLDSRIGGYMRKHVSYALSKRVLFSLTRMLALELAPHVRVNAVAPGMILAPDGRSSQELERLAARAPLGRWGAPEDVANAVVFLMRNDYLTGQVIYADGGAFIKEDLYG